MRASPQCHDLPLQPAHAVVLKFLHGLYVLVAGTDSRVHLLRILAQHRVHGGADRPRSVTLEPVSRCHPSCTGRCTRFGNNPAYAMAIGNGCAPHCHQHRHRTLSMSRESAVHLRRQHRQPPKAMCVLARHRACGGTRPPRSLDLERVSPCHSSCKSPCTRLRNNQPLTTCNCRRVCTPSLPSRCTGMAISTTAVTQLCVQPNHGRAHNPRHSTRTGSPSTLLHTQRRNSAHACTIAPSFSVHNWPTSGDNRPLTHSANGSCHAPRHRNDMK